MISGMEITQHTQHTRPRLLSRREVEDMVGLRHSAIYAWMSKGLFPLQVRIGGKAVRWHESEIIAWIDSQPRVAIPEMKKPG